ncbi:hypothetical protein K6Y31_03195 [Motilimonas cestriensis]|uniref:Uncharacterized protein n=1 Tax=Motilimonas cestriensis TaxID=2742685 RepID=A0ABS8W5M2_9GAMM|nr:hypothetical protein [Motilimonas cestriensis]MCE2593815.1 hypothetical protein [Motilimonas cestriensis]
MISLLHFLKNVGGLIFVSLFLLYTFMTQAQPTPDMNVADNTVVHVNEVALHSASTSTVKE